MSNNIQAAIQALVTESVTDGSNTVELFARLKKVMEGVFFPAMSSNYLPQIWTQFAMNVAILVLSVIGMTCRWKEGDFRLFRRIENGVKPNANMISQVCFGISSIFTIICTPIEFASRSTHYRDGQGPITAFAYTIFLISYLPFFVALSFVVLATLMAPTTSVRALDRGRGSTTDRDKWFLQIAIIQVGLISITFIPWIVYITYYRVSAIDAMENVFTMLGPMEVSILAGTTTNLLGATAFVPHLKRVGELPEKLMMGYRGYAGTGIVWLFLMLMVYTPTAVRLLLTLRSKKRRLLRSIKSLRALDALVTQGDIKTADWDEDAQQITNSQSLSGETTEQQAVRKTTFPPELLKKSNKPLNSVPRATPEEAVVAKRRTTVQSEELQSQLTKTQRVMFIVTTQFLITMSMTISTIAIALYIMAHDWTTVRKYFFVWTGWSLTFPTFLASGMFAWYCLAAMTKKPPSSSVLPTNNVPHSSNHPETHAGEVMGSVDSDGRRSTFPEKFNALVPKLGMSGNISDNGRGKHKKAPSGTRSRSSGSITGDAIKMNSDLNYVSMPVKLHSSGHSSMDEKDRIALDEKEEDRWGPEPEIARQGNQRWIPSTWTPESTV